MESKKYLIFEKTREILAKYEVSGVSKNRLIQELQDQQIASRVTVLEYLPEMSDPKKANIIELRTFKGKITPLCFPSKSNLTLVKLKEKFKLVTALLNLIKKHPELGDGFIPIPDFKNLHENNESIPPDSGLEHNFSDTFEMIHSKKTTFGESKTAIHLRLHKARHDLLANLPLFLTWYLEQPEMKYSNQIKEECIKILTPIFLNALKILHDDYSQTVHFSKQAHQIIKNTIPRDSVVITRIIKSAPMQHTNVEFLMILGRYYYTLSKRFSKNMRFDSSKEQKIISEFIKNFFDTSSKTHENDKTKLDTHDIQDIIKLCNDFNISRNKEDELKSTYGFEKNSIPIRLGLYNSDALHIRTYYLELFLNLGIFSKNEQIFLNYCLSRDKTEMASLNPTKPDDPFSDIFPKSEYWNFK